jgi:hypothetical protein
MPRGLAPDLVWHVFTDPERLRRLGLDLVMPSNRLM